MAAGTTAHRKWACPECHRIYENAVPAFEVVCGRNPKHPYKNVVMKPLDAAQKLGGR